MWLEVCKKIAVIMDMALPPPLYDPPPKAETPFVTIWGNK